MAAIQIYVSKKNFDQQKAERYFKERRIQVQLLDLKRHKLGPREIETLARGLGGVQNLLDREDKRVKEHPACYCTDAALLSEMIQENPWLLRSPILRCGSKVTVGYQPEVWAGWTVG